MPRQVNRRLVAAGSGLFAAAIGFFVFMMSIASRSTDPVELMRTVGGVSGTVVGLSIALVVAGLLGKGLAPAAKR